MLAPEGFDKHSPRHVERVTKCLSMTAPTVDLLRHACLAMTSVDRSVVYQSQSSRVFERLQQTRQNLARVGNHPSRGRCSTRKHRVPRRTTKMALAMVPASVVHETNLELVDRGELSEDPRVAESAQKSGGYYRRRDGPWARRRDVKSS